MASSARTLPSRILIAICAASVGLSAACSPTIDDVNYWRRSQKGPGKIVTVLLSPTYPMPLRIRAGMALVEMQRRDIDGVRQLRLAMRRIDEADHGVAAEIISGMTPELSAILETPPVEETPQEAAGEGEEATPVPETPNPPLLEIRAKDAAFHLAMLVEGEPRQRLAQALVAWFGRDLVRRSAAGAVTIDQAVREFGDDGAVMLVEAMNARIPKDTLVRVAQLISEHGSPETRVAGAQRLAVIQEEMEGDAYLAWLKQEIRAAMDRAGQERPDDWIEASATLSRETFINDGAMVALKFLSAEAPAGDRLVQVALRRPPEGADEQTVAILQARRDRALMALEGGAKPRLLPALLSIALSDEEPMGFRDLAFDRILETRSEEAIAPMWELVRLPGGGRRMPEAEAERQRKLRWRAGELVLTLGGVEIVDEFLRRLPFGRDAVIEPYEIEGYATRISQMEPPPHDMMRAMLRAHQWWRRALASYYLGFVGERADIEALSGLQSDSTPTAGEQWSAGDSDLSTVGKVAGLALTRLQERLSNQGGTSSPETAR